MTPDPTDLDPALRRTAGIAALRHLRRLVDEEAALERWRSRWALRLGICFTAIGALLLLWLIERA